MTIISDAELLAEVERFLRDANMAPSRFGRDVMGDGALVQHLRAGRSLSLANANKLVAFMADFEARAAIEGEVV